MKPGIVLHLHSTSNMKENNFELKEICNYAVFQGLLISTYAMIKLVENL